MKAHRDPSIDEIAREIARTRGRLARTADALAAKLAPRHLVREGMEMLHGFFRRRDTVKLGGELRADPVALGLVGLGVAWLVAENSGLLGRIIPDNAEPRSSTNPPVGAAPIEQPVLATQGAFPSVCNRGGAAIGQASELIAHPAQSGRRVPQAGGQVLDAVERNPLLFGLAGVAAGVAIAMLLPASRREREIATQARKGMWETAEEVGHRAAAAMRGMAAGEPGDREGLPHEPRRDKD